MKREILCHECRMSLCGKLGDYPNERITDVQGMLKRNCLCDFCGKELPSGSLAHAFSIRRPHETWAWEYDYVTQEPTGAMKGER